jgi:AraC-like DNA-binding protein
MEKKTEKIEAFHFFKTFIYHGIYRWIIVAGALLMFLIYVIGFRMADFVVFPNTDDFRIRFYNDSIDNGNSMILHSEVTDSAISVNFVLKEGFVRPYIGIIVQPVNQQPFDASPYNRLQVETSGENGGNMVVYLITQLASKKIKGRFFDCYVGSNINIPQTRNITNITIDQLKIPDWWYDVNNLSPSEEILPDWHHVIQLNLTTGLTPTVDVQREIKIRSIRFSRDNSWVIIAMSSFELMLILGLVLIHLVKIKKKRRTGVITIAYKPVEVNNAKTTNDVFLDFIHTHFHDSELSLETVSKTCNVSQRRIASTILEKYGCNFKTYINQIRINESKRLMCESDLNISEIAYKVGFNSPNHFNRVFKALTGNNPSGFMNQRD